MAVKKKSRTKKSAPKPIGKLFGGDDPLEQLWREDSQTIREFLNRRQQYEDLCSEVAHILRKGLRKEGVEIAAVTCRAKTLSSFAEKLIRKSYSTPLTEIEDFAGARIVCLYRTDLKKIEEIVQAEFEVIEKVDKSADLESDRFGYGAIHYIVKLSSSHSGARYDGLKDLVCEIQTRTVVQDAWAIIDHHLAYKHEGAVPTVILRKLYGLAAIFENADDQFVQLRAEREKYVRSIEEVRPSTEDFLDQEINIDTLEAFLGSKFPKHEASSEAWSTSDLSVFMSTYSDFEKLSDLDLILNRTEKARESAIAETGLETVTGTTEVLFALALIYPKIREDLGDKNMERFERALELVEPG